MSKKLKIVFWFLLGLCIYSCSTEPIYFSRNNYTYDKMVKSYNDIPVYRDSLVTQFILKAVYPKYPLSAKKSEWQGTVYVQPLIDEDGQVEAIYVNYSSDNGLSYACIEAIKNTKYKSHYDVKGTRTKYSLLIPLSFKLRK